MKSVSTSSLSSSNRPAYSCIRCSDRKVRCDRQNPCGACVKHNAQCIFRPPPSPRGKHKGSRTSVLRSRLKQYEALLHEQGVDPDEISREETVKQASLAFEADYVPIRQVPTPSSPVDESQRAFSKTQVVRGQNKSKFVDNSLWTRVFEEFQDSKEALIDHSSDDDLSDTDGAEEEHDFLFTTTPRSISKCNHPAEAHVLQLWQIFIENVDPLTKVVHVPSLQPAIANAISNIDNIPRGFESLLFSIYSAAVMSLKDNQCKDFFGESRKSLLSRYFSSTKIALSRANFMCTTNIIVLQALVLFLFSVRDIYQPRLVWTMTGVAVRVAEAMGLNHDGASLKLPPFEAEMRRRLWYQLKIHDFRMAELSGLNKFRGLDMDLNGINLPANVNDIDLFPNMSSPAVESGEPTQMIYCLLKSELGRSASCYAAKLRQQSSSHPSMDEHVWNRVIKNSDDFLEEIKEALETKYLRYCDPAVPLQLFAMLIGRTLINTGQFMTHHPRKWNTMGHVSDDERSLVWNVCLRILEQYDLVYSSKQLQHFAWHQAFTIQWHVVIHVLDTLRNQPLHTDVEKAWMLIECIYENNLEMMLNTRRPLFVAVGNLCLKAFEAHTATVKKEVIVLAHAPHYITKLREQREAAKVLRQSKAVEPKHTDHKSNRTDSKIRDTPTLPETSAMYLPEPTLMNDSIKHSEDARPDFNQTNDATEAISFWLRDDLDLHPSGQFFDPMNIDTDNMLIQDYSLDNDANFTVDWSQWDSWLGIPRPMHIDSTTRS